MCEDALVELFQNEHKVIDGVDSKDTVNETELKMKNLLRNVLNLSN